MTTIAPTPWRIFAKTDICDADEKLIFVNELEDATWNEAEELAERTIRCVNTHDALVAALTGLVETLEYVDKCRVDPFGLHHNDAMDSITAAHKALAAASGGEVP